MSTSIYIKDRNGNLVEVKPTPYCDGFYIDAGKGKPGLITFKSMADVKRYIDAFDGAPAKPDGGIK